MQQDSEEGDSGQKSHLVLHGVGRSVSRTGVWRQAAELLTAPVGWLAGSEAGLGEEDWLNLPAPACGGGMMEGRGQGRPEPSSLVRLGRQKPGPDGA